MKCMHTPDLSCHPMWVLTHKPDDTVAYVDDIVAYVNVFTSRTVVCHAGYPKYFGSLLGHCNSKYTSGNSVSHCFQFCSNSLLTKEIIGDSFSCDAHTLQNDLQNNVKYSPFLASFL